MRNVRVAAFLLAFKGACVFLMSVIDWLTAKAGVSERHYLIPLRVAGEFHKSVVNALHGQVRNPSLVVCTHWNPRAGGPTFRGRFENVEVQGRRIQR